MAEKLNAEDNLGLDDSFSNFTILRDDGTDIKGDTDGGDNDNADSEDDDVTDDNMSETNDSFEFDLSKAPEDIQKVLEPVLKKMQSAYTKKTQGIAELKKKAAVADVLISRGGNTNTIEDEHIDTKNKGLEDANSILAELKGLKFEQGDYYAPFFKKIIDAFETVVTSTKKEVGNVRKEHTVSSIKKWFKDNPEALPLMKNMDEIGRAHPTLYNDLDDLYVMASVKAGKGIPGKNKQKQVVSNPNNKPKIKRPTSLRNVIEISGLPENRHAVKKVESMRDAFQLAQEQLAND